MKYFDLHCDTALSIWKNSETITQNSCHISLEKAAEFEKYIQLTAFFTSPALSDSEGWEQFLAVYSNLLDEADKNGIDIIKTAHDLDSFMQNSRKKYAFILTMEDVRIIDGKTERIAELYEKGIRVITPVWGGLSSVGGAHDTNEGLTSFGSDAVHVMCRCGIIPDLSHASRKTAEEIMDIAEEYGVSPIATHSNAYAVCQHSRNLTDAEFVRLTSLGGIAGISLCPKHLSGKGDAALSDDVLPHILHYEQLAASHTAFGCDFDGTSLPNDIDGIGFMPQFEKKLTDAGLQKEAADHIFFTAAYAFFMNNLPK